jgi:LuxR family transcriptional regulator
MLTADSSITIDVMKSLSEVTENIVRSCTPEDFLQSVATSFEEFGFNSFNLGCNKLNKYELALNPTLTNWPREFMLEYERRHWADFDPTLARAVAADKAFEWNVGEIHLDRRHREYMEFLLTTPLRGGFSIPLKAKNGMLSSISVESHQDQQFAEWVPQALSVIANCAVMKAEALGLCRDKVSTDESLSARRLSQTQLEILKWAASGKSNGDIGLIVNLSERAVKYHVSECLKKLGVATRSQAVAALVREGKL